jgi:hypothetical protein
LVTVLSIIQSGVIHVWGLILLQFGPSVLVRVTQETGLVVMVERVAVVVLEGVEVEQGRRLVS